MRWVIEVEGGKISEERIELSETARSATVTCWPVLHCTRNYLRPSRLQFRKLLCMARKTATARVFEFNFGDVKTWDCGVSTTPTINQMTRTIFFSNILLSLLHVLFIFTLLYLSVQAQEFVYESSQNNARRFAFYFYFISYSLLLKLFWRLQIKCTHSTIVLGVWPVVVIDKKCT